MSGFSENNACNCTIKWKVGLSRRGLNWTEMSLDKMGQQQPTTRVEMGCCRCTSRPAVGFMTINNPNRRTPQIPESEKGRIFPNAKFSPKYDDLREEAEGSQISFRSARNHRLNFGISPFPATAKIRKYLSTLTRWKTRCEFRQKVNSCQRFHGKSVQQEAKMLLFLYE